ncbi:hypothetical protein BELL_1118g00030 [Botrytis elliptica]|uniref:Uncharacterized protein n=1 Tax=Botrytis elliptica TaxID=278938 RepID=A0A4Z1ISY4_9HELO|nr:hypothetical protein EAE99_005816 [Botrytis elliptica]TGO62430.1 hypothetical protein BELL_1118g00030 [Botrytis elliptica]
MSNQNNSNDANKAQGEKYPTLRLPDETMPQSFDRLAREARELGVHPDIHLANATRNSARRFHVPSDPQADGSTSGHAITVNPQDGNGTSGGGQNTSSAPQASSGSGAGTSSGNASRQSNPGAQRD